MNEQELLGMQAAEFAMAATLQSRAFWLQVASVVVGTFAAGVPSSEFGFGAALLAVALAILWKWLDHRQRGSRTQAERARRATLLITGLGDSISASEIVDLMAHFTVKAEDGVRCQDSTYFATKQTPGDLRLLEMLDESAFWSRHLVRECSKLAWRDCGMFLIAGFGAIAAAVAFGDPSQTQHVVQLVCLPLVFLMSNEVAGSAFAYEKASSGLQRFLPRLDAARVAGIPRADLLMLLMDYNSIVETTPLFRGGVYAANKDRLNDLWKQRPNL